MTITKHRRSLVWKKTDGHCWYCGVQTVLYPEKVAKTISSAIRMKKFTIDHLVPRKTRQRRNTDPFERIQRIDSIENLVPACKSCNKLKNSMTLEEFRTLIVLQQIAPFYYQEKLFYFERLEERDAATDPKRPSS